MNNTFQPFVRRHFLMCTTIILFYSKRLIEFRMYIQTLKHLCIFSLYGEYLIIIIIIMF